jgi:hypothetical protein
VHDERAVVAVVVPLHSVLEQVERVDRVVDLVEDLALRLAQVDQANDGGDEHHAGRGEPGPPPVVGQAGRQPLPGGLGYRHRRRIVRLRRLGLGYHRRSHDCDRRVR